MSNHGLTPVRPRTTPIEATILDELRELREQNRALDDRVKKLERVHLLTRQKGPSSPARPRTTPWPATDGAAPSCVPAAGLRRVSRRGTR